jgi:hypothetical protein
MDVMYINPRLSSIYIALAVVFIKRRHLVHDKFSVFHSKASQSDKHSG